MGALGIKYGETCPLKFTCKDKTGLPVDMTEGEIVFELYDELLDDVPSLVKKLTTDITEDGAISDPSSGKFYVLFTPKDYEQLYKGRQYFLSVWLVKSDCKKVISSATDKNCIFTVFYP